MRNNVMTIIKKELLRFFMDKRMVFTTILMPGIMIYVLYSFMGSGLMEQFAVDEDYSYQVYEVNMPDSIQTMLDEADIQADVLEDETSLEEKKTAVSEQEADILLVFPENFEADVESYDCSTSTEAAPQVEVYYNSARTESAECMSMISELLDAYESSMANRFDVNAGEDSYDLATEKDTTAMIFSMMLPMLLMIFLFSGCMAIAPESIAGEKERGTIATLLVTPMKRTHLALGKIISLAFIGLLSGISSFLGTMLSLPKLMGGMEEMSAAVYTVSDYLLLLLVILTTVLVLIGALAVISAYAKSVKEASSMIMPLMVIVMLISITSMLGKGAVTESYLYLIPLYNSVQCMNGIFSFDYQPVNMIITLAANLVYSLGLTVLLAKMFDNERIMYS
ncbi:MAG: ABC transporter permease [Roseburia sp.]